MKLDFDIETKSPKLEFDMKDTKVVNAGGGISENRVQQIVEEKTKDLQPKTDETLDTESKQVVGAINEVNSGLVKQMDSSLNEETNELTVELKDKNGKVIARTKVVIPKGEIPDLSAYVKNTDYASEKSVGVVKTSSAHGTSMDVGGIIKTSPALPASIDLKSSYHLVLVPKYLDYAFKVAATTNTEAWTDDETKAARDLICAVGKKDSANSAQISEKIRTDRFLSPYYVDRIGVESLANCKEPKLWTDDSTDENGEVVKGTKTKALELLGALQKPKNPNRASAVTMQGVGTVGTTAMVHESAAPWSIAVRDNAGCIKTATPKASGDSANKDYIDNLPDNLTLTDDERAKWCELFGALLKGTSSDILCSNGTTLKWDYGVIGGSLIRRYGNGSARVNMPSKIEDESDYDITNRGYVNGKYAELLARIEALENK